jgi:hypothetical protein
MSTPLFTVEVVGLQPGSIELECTPRESGSMAVTRSFAYLVLRELDELHSGGAIWRARTAAFAHDELDAEFFQLHLDALIASTQMIAVPGHADGRYRLLVVFAEGVQFAASLHIRLDTTAYDVWLDDPQNPLQPELRPQRAQVHATTLAAREQPSVNASSALERMLDALVANQLIELEPKSRGKLLTQLGKIDARDELTYVHKLIDTLSTSKWVEELYGADEELTALLQTFTK